MNDYIKDLNLPSPSEEEKASCDSPVAEEELGDAVKSMKSGSAPGSDGIPTEFYITFWPYLKGPLINCINYSFLNDKLSLSERIGVISLFHKGKDLARDNLDN